MKRIILLSGLLLPILGFAQLRGRVINETNAPLPFSTVAVKNKSNVTVADSTGRFSLPVDEVYPYTLVITSAGYERQERVIRNSSNNDLVIQLQSLFQRDTVVITSRRRREVLQDVPIPISVVSGNR